MIGTIDPSNALDLILTFFEIGIIVAVFVIITSMILFAMIVAAIGPKTKKTSRALLVTRAAKNEALVFAQESL